MSTMTTSKSSKEWKMPAKLYRQAKSRTSWKRANFSLKSKNKPQLGDIMVSLGLHIDMKLKKDDLYDQILAFFDDPAHATLKASDRYKNLFTSSRRRRVAPNLELPPNQPPSLVLNNPNLISFDEASRPGPSCLHSTSPSPPRYHPYLHPDVLH